MNKRIETCINVLKIYYFEITDTRLKWNLMILVSNLCHEAVSFESYLHLGQGIKGM